MSGICLEFYHIFDSFTDCLLCFRPGFSAVGSDDDDHDTIETSSERSFTIQSRVAADYDQLPYHDYQDYLEVCGRRVSDAMSGSIPDQSSLSIETLLSMNPIVNGTDLIRMAARHLFVSHVKSQECVRETFFSAHKVDHKYEDCIDHRWFDFSKFACLYVCQVICKIKDQYEMFTLLDEKKVEEELRSFYYSPHWKKIGFALYTLLFQNLVKDEQTKTPFISFVNDDRQGWARRLSERVRSKQWVYTHLIHPVVQGHCPEEKYNRDLNILFIKLHLLDPSTVMPTYDYLRKALPDLNLGLVTTNYLGEPLDWNTIKPDVESALNRETYPTANPRLSLNEVEVFYGLQVLEFIMQEAKERGLWTGKHPDNRRVTQLRDRCLIM